MDTWPHSVYFLQNVGGCLQVVVVCRALCFLDCGLTLIATSSFMAVCTITAVYRGAVIL